MNNLIKFLPKNHQVQLATEENILSILAKASPRSRQEIHQCLVDYQPKNLATQLLGHAELLFTIHDEDTEEPHVLFGFFPIKEGVVETCMIVSDFWENDRRGGFLKVQTTRILRDLIVPLAQSDSVRRVEARSLSPNETVQAWFKLLRATKEGELKAWGIDKTTFFLYAWTHEYLNAEPI